MGGKSQKQTRKRARSEAHAVPAPPALTEQVLGGACDSRRAKTASSEQQSATEQSDGGNDSSRGSIGVSSQPEEICEVVGAIVPF